MYHGCLVSGWLLPHKQGQSHTQSSVWLHSLVSGYQHNLVSGYQHSQESGYQHSQESDPILGSGSHPEGTDCCGRSQWWAGTQECFVRAGAGGPDQHQPYPGRLQQSELVHRPEVYALARMLFWSEKILFSLVLIDRAQIVHSCDFSHYLGQNHHFHLLKSRQFGYISNQIANHILVFTNCSNANL